MNIKSDLQSIIDSIVEEWLEENARPEKDSVAYGDTYVNYTSGYSDRDWERANQYAKEKLVEEFNEIINNN